MTQQTLSVARDSVKLAPCKGGHLAVPTWPKACINPRNSILQRVVDVEAVTEHPRHPEEQMEGSNETWLGPSDE